jgi:hypothetical protein
MTNNFDAAIEIAVNNDSGAAVCQLAPSVQLLVSNRGETFTVWDYRPNAKRVEKTVNAVWAHKFLSRANNVTVTSFDW